MNVRVYKKLYRELLEREHIELLPETIFVAVRNCISSYAEKNGRVATSGRLRNGKQAFFTWLVRYHKQRVRKPSEGTLGNMQLLGILFLYVWHVEAKEDIEDDFLVEEALKEFNRNREYRRTFELPKLPQRRGRPPLHTVSVRNITVAKKMAGKRTAAKKTATRATVRKSASKKSPGRKIALKTNRRS